MAEIPKLLAAQRAFFQTGRTRPFDFRKDALNTLKDQLKARETDILEALRKDLHKPNAEAYLTEIGFLFEEIGHTLKHLEEWMKPRRRRSSLFAPFSTSRIHAEPLGTVLIIGPWNYPFQLLISPLVGAIAAGNCSVLKPSELAPHTSAAVARLVASAFDPGFITVAEGGVEVSQALLAEKWDHIFFTGGTQVGKHIMAAAAKHLTPVTLELGGKSPCIVDEETDLEGTARRIAWGKFLNAGQTCVAPDYLLVPPSLKKPLVDRLAHYVKQFFGDSPEHSPDYARIINARHFQRLTSLIDKSKVAFGGEGNAEKLYLAPTVMTDVKPGDKVMEDEIFGPILPVVEYRTLDEAIHFVNSRPKPLALYFFGKNRDHEKRILAETSFGGGCINDTLVHLGNPRLPFGGVGESGMGAYHGKYSFDTFSHFKSVVKRSFLVDPMLRYPPYKGRVALFKKIMG